MELAHNWEFLFMSQCFQKSLAAEEAESICILERVNCVWFDLEIFQFYSFLDADDVGGSFAADDYCKQCNIWGKKCSNQAILPFSHNISILSSRQSQHQRSYTIVLVIYKADISRNKI